MAYKSYIIPATLVILWTLEVWIPHIESFVRHPRKRWQHGIKHLLLGLINWLVGVLLVAGLTVKAVYWSKENGFGLANMIAFPDWLTTVGLLIIFDCWTYVWHRLNHAIPFLWRFHRTHHSDVALDSTSALRFHPGEVLLSGLSRIVIMVLLGMTVSQLVLYEAIFFPIILLHHSNINIRKKLDDFLRTVIVTPWMHWVHHSRLRPETNSNYGSILSFWDRVFGTFRLREDPSEIRYGLDGYDDDRHQSWFGIMATPFIGESRKSSDNDVSN